jgi:hypothetical protein
MIFSLIFLNSNNDEFEIEFESYDNSISDRWSMALYDQCQRDNRIIEPDRLYNFPDGQWTEEMIVNELNSCIDVLNRYSQVISHRAFVGMPQEQLNNLHHYFENLRGGVLSPGSYYKSANALQRDCLDRYNVIIHRAENFYSGHTKQGVYPRIVSRFHNRQRYPLMDKDYQHFTFERYFGELYINYCEVGKPIYDVYKDNDDIVGEDNIRPLRFYSPDFTCYFHNRSLSSIQNFENGMNEWWDRNDNYLTALGFTKGDPRNAMGYIPVGKLITKYSEQQLVQLICEYNTMDRVEIKHL